MEDAMKHYLMYILMIFAANGFAQNFTINNLSTDSIFIGRMNKLQLTGYNQTDNIALWSPSSVRVIPRCCHQFELQPRKNEMNQPFFVVKDNITVDTIILSAFSVTMKEFLATKNHGLINSGTYPLEVIQGLKSINLVINIPQYKVKFHGYYIEMGNTDGVYHFEKVKDGRLDHPSIKKALKKLKRNGYVRIYRVRAKLPWDCGRLPKSYLLKVK